MTRTAGELSMIHELDMKGGTTMAYRVKTRAMSNDLEPGDRVRSDADQVDAVDTITSIRK